MDAISYSYADKQAKNIKKIINDPDSTSGIVTVPKVIATGENITVPAGRVAILPNVQVDGTLNISGEVFVPSGSTYGDLDTQIALKANINSPALTGTPTAPTPSAGDNSTKLATTAYVDGKMVRGTAVNSTSGTSIDFTGIPSWAKRITVMFNGVSTNGTSLVQVQIGSTSITSTGYQTGSSTFSNGGTALVTSPTTGFVIMSDGSASYTRHGLLILSNISSNTWVASGNGSDNTTTRVWTSGGSVALSGVLDRIRITTVNGTDTFDAGQINIMYEG